MTVHRLWWSAEYGAGPSAAAGGPSDAAAGGPSDAAAGGPSAAMAQALPPPPWAETVDSLSGSGPTG